MQLSINNYQLLIKNSELSINNYQLTINRYAEYKDSGVDWIGKIPAHWEIKRVKYVTEMFVSNVDKHVKPLEKKVRLCNYVDVYKNDFITEECDFMLATASKDEIESFKIRIDDVIITKDSEDWLDIGVPALVKFEDENLICGYHLAILRPKSKIIGGYLFRSLLTPEVKTQFSINANGITRYGISHSAIKSTWIIVPPLAEQTAIAEFLDEKTGKIDTAVAQKERLIALLQERKQIIIQAMVSGQWIIVDGKDGQPRIAKQNDRGQFILDGAPLPIKTKPSAVEWLGDIPEHWEIVRNNTLFEEKNTPGNDDLPILSVSIHSAVSSKELDDNDNIRGKIRIQDKSSYKSVEVNDIVFNMMRAWQGAIGAVKNKGMVSPAYIVAHPNWKVLAPFFEYQYRTELFIGQMNRYSKGITDFRKRLYWDEFKQLSTILPPISEQRAIVAHIEAQTAKIERAIALLQEQIAKLKEYKTILINSAVTGKIIVN